MKHFCIITNNDKDKDLIMTARVVEYLKSHGCTAKVYIASRRMEGRYHYTNPEDVPEEAECVIVLGGDGTLLQAARDLVQKDIPLFGINLGDMGYLAEVDRHSIFPALSKLIADNFEVEERMMLSGTVFRGDEVIGEGIALNDIVISRDRHLRVIKFRNFVNNEYLTSYNADGIIFSSPTGSTGYSLSAGGPVVSPRSALIIMTPVAPHTMNIRSVILPAEDVVTVEIGEGRHNNIEKALASFDGDAMVQMVTGDHIVIRRAEATTKILKLSHLSFVEILRQKMRNS